MSKGKNGKNFKKKGVSPKIGGKFKMTNRAVNKCPGCGRTIPDPGKTGRCKGCKRVFIWP